MKKFTLNNGYNIKLDGNPELKLINKDDSNIVQYNPSSIRSFKTKLLIKLNDYVKIGTPLFFDKNNPEVMFVSSVSGYIKEIILGDRRVVKEISINNDMKKNQEDACLDRTKETLLKSGLWSMFRQKPFSKIPDPQSHPKSIFISTIPTEPFSIDNDFLFGEIDNFLQSGIDILKEVFNCDINVSVSSSSSFKTLEGVNLYTFNKLHPSGNVGVQIHHIDPIKNANDTRWYLTLQDLNNIGMYFSNKQYPTSKYISIGGNAFIKPAYYKMLIGTPVSNIVQESHDNVRYISGDVLNGVEINYNDSINLNHEILSIIKTNNNQQFLGWLMPGLKKYSISNTFLSKIISNRKSILDTKINGSIRSIIPMGIWDKVLPMNIYAEFLIKSIIAKDIDMMEKLGIYESSPEDFALCSFVCQSKVEVSAIIQDGLNLVESEI
jgi:Na+-transporting NADH:ubiquinone oxidoreductase subunit A